MLGLAEGLDPTYILDSPHSRGMTEELSPEGAAFTGY